MPERVVNYGAGPAKLPEAVMEAIQRDGLRNWRGTGVSVLECSHRQAAFEDCLKEAGDCLHRLLNAPSDVFTTVWMAGGGHGQFAAIVYNILGKAAAKSSSADDNTPGTTPSADVRQNASPLFNLPPVDYIVTGSWSDRAAKEAIRLGANVNIIQAVGRDANGLAFITAPSTWNFSFKHGQDPAYVYYCDNETVDGIEIPSDPHRHGTNSGSGNASLGSETGHFILDHIPPHIPIVCDQSSNFVTRPTTNIARYGVIFAGVQKNLGTAGVAAVLIRRDLLKPKVLPAVPIPSLLDYALNAQHGSLYNTPPVFSIYTSGLVLEWTEKTIGPELSRVDAFSRQKAQLIWDQLDDGLFYYSPVAKPFRSRMNVVFRLRKEHLESAFLKQAEERGMVQLKGHRSVGGLRASIYNSITLEEVAYLVAFMREFRALHQGE